MFDTMHPAPLFRPAIPLRWLAGAAIVSVLSWAALIGLAAEVAKWVMQP